MIEPVDTNQIQDLFPKPSPKATNPADTRPDNNADASLQVDYASLIEEATQIPLIDAEAVQHARELLSSGQLESPQNIREAAENIANLGI